MGKHEAPREKLNFLTPNEIFSNITLKYCK